ncbi:MFS transporter [Kitasatospora sp. MMS16-BH015]|uniref:MFS transporter n=1 Tax=Kitasatospora sp. MMS16-BH015 TaxID=2018025 RepID=UPI000CA34681|nr:MFS transporter [Kitasatospora sp. MMS16-BH015]AUG75701.1 MFS transporter [Kitasatospora sp. MMS16-BH015]
MTAVGVERGAAEELVPLRRNWRFQVLWGGAASSMLGARIADTAYPLMLLAMTGSATVAGAFSTAQLATTVVLGVHGGVVADRRNRRHILMAADGFRFCVTLSVVTALALGHLTVWHTLLAGISVGGAIAYGGPVRMIALRSVVPPEQLRLALSQDEARSSGAGLLGPPLAGWLLSVGRITPFVGTALGSLLSFLAACAVRFDGRPGTATTRERGGALDGFRLIAAAPLLRSTLLISMAINIVAAAVLLPVIVLMRDGGTSSGGIGLALSGEAVGGILGAFLVTRLHGLMGPGKLLLATSWVLVPCLLGPLLPGGPVAVFLSLLVSALGIPALKVMVDVLIFQRVPDEVRGRVVAATITAFMMGMPAGMMSSGLLLDHLSPSAVLVLYAVLLAGCLVPVTLSRSLRAARWEGEES